MLKKLGIVMLGVVLVTVKPKKVFWYLGGDVIVSAIRPTIVDAVSVSISRIIFGEDPAPRSRNRPVYTNYAATNFLSRPRASVKD